MSQYSKKPPENLPLSGISQITFTKITTGPLAAGPFRLTCRRFLQFLRQALPALLALLLVFTPLLPALAQGEPLTVLFEFVKNGVPASLGWFFDESFDQEEGGTEEGFDLIGPEQGQYPNACEDGYCIAAGGTGSGMMFTAVFALSTDVDIHRIRFRMTTAAEALGRYIRVKIYDSAMDLVYNPTARSLTGPGGPTVQDYNLTEEPIIGRYIVVHTNAQWSTFVDWIELTVDEAPDRTEGYTLPLSAGEYTSELHTWTLENEGDPIPDPVPAGDNDFLMLYASLQLQAVHSPTTGVVVDISPFTEADCTEVVSAAPADIGAAISGILVAVNPLVGAAGGIATFVDLLAWQAGGSGSFCKLDRFLFNDADFFDEQGINDYYVPIAGDLVTIQSTWTGDLLTYLVMDSEFVIEVGSPVTPGCVIGGTLPMWWGRIYPAPQEYINRGLGLIWAESSAEEPIDVFSQYRVMPESVDVACNAASFTDCINPNPDFDYMGAASMIWQFQGSGQVNPEGATTGLVLSPTGITAASHGLMLAPDPVYTIKVIAHVQTPNTSYTDSEIDITLGTTTHTRAFPYTGEQTEFIIDAQQYTGDLWLGMYTLAVELADGEDGEVVIDFLCVSDNDDPVMERPTCLFTNPGFDQASDWTLTGTAEIASGFLRMAENDTASQTITLAADTYTFEISARGEAGGPVTNTITIGGASSGQFAVGDYLGVDYWQGQSFTPSVGGTITQITVDHLGISGSPSGTVTAEIRSASGSNPGTVLWSGAYTPSLNSTNTINVASGPEVTAETVYWLVVRPTNPQSDNNWWWVSYVNNSYADGASANSANGGSSWTATPSYDLDLSVSVSYVASGTNIDWALGEVADGTLTPGENWGVVSESFTLDAAADGETFTLSPDAAAQIDYVCLIPENQPTAPPVADYPDIRDCNSCPIDLTGDVAHDVYESVAWHDCRARQVYYCDMRKILVDVRTNTANAVRGIGMFGRYTGAVANTQLKFLQGMTYYLAGYLNNVALAIQDSIAWQTGYSTLVIDDQPLGLWDVLGLLLSGLRDVLVTALDRLATVAGQLFTFLAPIVGTLLSVLESAVDMLIAFIETVFDQLQILQYLISAVVTGANNATPEAIPGAPNCAANPEGLCWGIYLLDNTIFSGPVKDLLPILAGAMTLNLLVWTVGRFRRAFENIA